MSTRKQSVIIVDDDVRMLRMMKRTLELEGFRVLTVNGGEAFLKIFENENPELVLLDIMMPDIDGYTVCRRVREFSQVPIIMVTARDDDREKVLGLDIGADDYVTKPFSARELVARVRAVLRRGTNLNTPLHSRFQHNDLVIDFASHRVNVGDREIELTPTEYRLLTYMSFNAGRVVTPDQLLDKVWGEEYMGSPHLLQVNIARLRQKLGDHAKNPTHIMTRPGIGYMMLKTQ